MKKSNLRQFTFNAGEASEAFADYILKKTGEMIGPASGMNINIDANKKTIIWTVALTPAQEDEPLGVLPFLGDIDGNGGQVH